MLGTRSVNLVGWLRAPGLPGPSATPGPQAAWSTGRVWGPALLIVAVVALVRAAFVLWLSPYHLTEDEAFYWEWSRHLDWSYNTKGPGIAWSIAAATSLLGTSAGAIRMVAVLSAAIMSLALLGLLRDVTKGSPGPVVRRAALVTAALAQLAPGLQVTGLLSTIDGPYLACWALACWAGYRALARGSHLGWVSVGAAVGVGFLFKYTILLLLPGLIAVALLHRRRLVLGPLWRRSLLGGVAIAALGLLPVTVWNAQHDWATVRHLLGHLGVNTAVSAAEAGAGAGGPTAPVGGVWVPGRHVPEFVGSQVGLLGPGIAGLMLLACWSALRGRRGAWAAPASAPEPAETDEGPRLASAYLLWCALPILGFYAAISVFSGVEGNWPIAGYLSLIPLAGAWVTARAVAPPIVGGVRAAPGPGVRSAFACWHLSIIVGLITGSAMLRLDLVQAGLAGIDPRLGRVVPMSRLMGGPELAQRVHAEAGALEQRTGRRPFIVAQHYGRAALLAFYLPGRPTVYAASSRVGGRVVQQDYWPSHSLDDASLLGRPAVILADFDTLAPWVAGFEGVQRLGDGQRQPAPETGRPPLNPRWLFVGLGYKGLPRPERPVAY